MNIDLLVTDLLPFVTPLYSYGYAQKTGAVTNGNKVKICVLLPWELWLARLSVIGNKVTNDFCVFLCIYAFLCGRMTDRADTNKSHPKGNIERLENRANTSPQDGAWLLVLQSDHISQLGRNTTKHPLKNFDFDKFTVFFTVFWNLLKI